MSLNATCRSSESHKRTCGEKPGVCPCGNRSFGLSLASYAPREVNADRRPEFNDPFNSFKEYYQAYLTMLTKPVTITS